MIAELLGVVGISGAVGSAVELGLIVIAAKAVGSVVNAVFKKQ